MRRGTLLLILLMFAAACGGGTTSSTPTAESVVTTTPDDGTTTTLPPPLTDPRFPETNLSARFELPVDASVAPGFAPHRLLALFYRSVDGPLVMVLTGFDSEVSAGEQCGWILIQYGPAAVLAVADWERAPWDSYSNQPWSTVAGLTQPHCEQEFLEDGGLRPDVATATECGDYLVVVADQLQLVPADLGAEVGSPYVELLVAVAGSTVELEAIPWAAHPGASPNLGDLVEIDLDTLICP